MDDTYKRVRARARRRRARGVREHWNERFLWALRRGAIPAGRIISNAGALEHKPRPRHQLHGLGHDPRLDGRQS